MPAKRPSSQSLYSSNCVPTQVDASDPKPFPGTIETAQIETVDNDRAGLMLDAGVVR